MKRGWPQPFRGGSVQESEGVREKRGGAWRCKEFVIAHMPGELMETAAALQAI
jgi:hypothetical protein